MAQETTADIAGIVGSKDGPVPGASIIAVHIPTGTRYATVSRKDGRYNLPNLRVGGPYTLTISFIGYKDEKRENISLSLGQEYKADVNLVQSTSSLNEVVVKSAAQNKVINKGRTGSQEVITRSQLDRLPTVSRSMADFTKLAPSANGLSFGGRSNQYNNITVDGANFNNSFGLQPTLGSQTGSQPISLEALEQIQVNVSPYDVRQGGFSGAGINSVTKSGTNEFKGSVYTYVQTPGLQGRNVNNVTVPRPDFNYNLRGFSAGGAFVKNKLFFFISAEQERIKAPATSLVANKPGGVAGGNVSRAVADTLDALKQFLMSTYKYDPGSYQDYSYRTQSDKITVKIDWNVNDNNTFTFKYNYLKSFKDIPASNSGAPGTGRQPSSTGLPFSGSGYTINNNFNIFIAELNTRIGNKASNKFQVGFSAMRDFRSSLSGGNFPLVDILDGQGSSYTAFGYEPFTYNNKLNSNIYQLSDIFTLYKGKHEITFGTQNYYKTFLNGFAPNYEGNYRFNSMTDFYASAKNGSLTAARYALSYASTPDGSFPYAKIHSLELGFFAQDKWSITPSFTLTYGLRIDVPVIGNTFTRNDSLTALTFRDGVKLDVGQAPKTSVLVSPRVGFNWDVTHDGKTQIRGGAGLFAGPPPAVWLSNQAGNNGVQFGSFVAQTSASSPTIPYAFNPDPNAYRPGPGKLSTAYNIAAIDRNFKYPQVLKATLAIDRQLPGGIIGTLEANYAKDINAVYFQNVNLPNTGFQLDSTPDHRFRYTSAQIYGPIPGGKNTLSNPNISDAILMKNSNKGYSYFFTLQLQKSTPKLYLSAAYTYSKARSINDGGTIAQSNWRDRPVSGDPNADVLGYSNYYMPHRIVAAATYRFTWAKNFATSVGMVFEAAPAAASAYSSVASYTYSGDLNGDASNGNNDLIYIPNNANEIKLVPVGYGDKGYNPSTNPDQRSASVIWNQLDNYIKQDDYLSHHRGQYAERNALVLPFYKRMDLNITQDVFVYAGKNKTKHTLRITFDIINFGNFLNRRWGVSKMPNNTSFLKYEGQLRDANGVATAAPAFSFPYLDPKNQIPLTNTWKDNTSTTSRWQGQIGIRYMFN
ncbi:TonB-dependent receptor [Chitinophaga vietnamensis]|uniref:TonB-dependent receptor n=1 Tax=Chitinophaga vietnamensis TaxID=2593957 RepID=UPI001F25DE51|nr:carboxypeptidase regulatory-like domain-containing protein [Chitinophaga vietnamensis]